MTKHLSPQELSAHQDGMLSGMPRARAEAHLATCVQCRAELERAVGLDNSLAGQLVKDPSENYFRDFASRIEARIHPAGAAKLGPKAPPGEGFWAWLNTPIGMSWAGAAAVLVVGAGVALITVRAISPNAFHAPPGATHAEPAPAAAPPAAAPPSVAPSGSPIAADQMTAQNEPPASAAQVPASPSAPASGGEPANGALADDRPKDERAQSAPARAVEVKPGANGEDVVVDRRRSPSPAPAPQAAAELKGSGPVKVRKSVTAQPLASNAADQDAGSAKSSPPPRQDALQRTGSSATTSSSRDGASPPGLRLGTAPTGATQRCGAVHDGTGRAVAGAQLMLVETGSSAQSHSDGSFCLDLNSAARTLVVMAVGFEAQRITLDPADDGPLTLTLRAVSVMGGSAGSGSATALAPSASRWVQKPGAASTSGAGLDATHGVPTPVGSTEAFASLSDSVRALTIKALQFENDAARLQSAEQFKLAGEEWQKVLKRTIDTPAENETRFRVAAAYYRAWQLDPTHGRSVIALEAISSFVLRAPAGPERDQATMWLGQLRWGDSNNTDH